MTNADDDPATPKSLNTPLCADCGFPAGAEMLAETPDCPHGWLSLEGMPLADIKAVFAKDGTFNLGGAL